MSGDPGASTRSPRARGGRLNEFGSGLLVRLVQISLAETGVSCQHLDRPTRALLPLPAKRLFLERIYAAHGPVALLRAGTLLGHMETEPTVAALLAARSAEELFERWQRLERFTHSHHRVVIRHSTPRCIVAEHVGSRGDPRACEDVLILGVLAALLRGIGANGVTAQLGRGPQGPVLIAGDEFRAPPRWAPTALWRLSWTAFCPRTLDGVAVPAVSVTDRVRSIFAADAGRSWRVAELARLLSFSSRSLQRELEPAGGFADLLGQARAAKAGEMLLKTQQPICLVGFACGYADQPHFTREFKRRTAMTPSAYRAAFGSQLRRGPRAGSNVPRMRIPTGPAPRFSR